MSYCSEFVIQDDGLFKLNYKEFKYYLISGTAKGRELTQTPKMWENLTQNSWPQNILHPAELLSGCQRKSESQQTPFLS